VCPAGHVSFLETRGQNSRWAADGSIAGASYRFNGHRQYWLNPDPANVMTDLQEQRLFDQHMVAEKPTAVVPWGMRRRNPSGENRRSPQGRASPIWAIIQVYRAVTTATLRDHGFDPPRQLWKRGNDTAVEINAVTNKQSAECFIASPEIGMRQIHRVNEIDGVRVLNMATVVVECEQYLGRNHP
jgi:hypothetical protein